MYRWFYSRAIDASQLNLPNILDNDMYQNMAKTLNTANILMNMTVQKLQGIRGMSTFLILIFKTSELPELANKSYQTFCVAQVVMAIIFMHKVDIKRG